jgi:hypothetical protein
MRGIVDIDGVVCFLSLELTTFGYSFLKYIMIVQARSIRELNPCFEYWDLGTFVNFP